MRGLLKANAFILLLVGILMVTQPQYRIVVEPAPSQTPEPSPTAEPVILTGIATWYDATKNHAWYTRKNGGYESNQHGGPYAFYGAAGPALRDLQDFTYNNKPYQVLVTSVLTKRTVVVWVVDWCSCNGVVKDPTDNRLIDLAPAVWNALGVRLGRGIMKVNISLLNNGGSR
jgi:rare lipoprotein A (peptidoglycan hydrolase)